MYGTLLRTLLAALLLAVSGLSHAIFNNGGFEGSLPLDNSGPWKFEKGTSAALSGSMPYTRSSLRLTPGGGRALTSAIGSTSVLNTDGNVVSPRLGSASVIVNGNNTSDTGASRNYNRLTQQDAITNADRDPLDGRLHVRFAWAAALEAAGHGAADQPYIYIALRDMTAGGTILWEELVYEGDPSKFFTVNSGGTWSYTNWRNVDIEVPDSALGHTLEIDVLAAGCSAGGHGGYVLFDAFGSSAVPPSPAVPLPVLSITPLSLSYTSPVGATTASQAVTVSNTGTATLQLGNLSITGTDAGSFAIVPPGGGDCASNSSVAVGASCTVRVTFTPGSGGAKYGWLSIESNDRTGRVALQGNNGILTLSVANLDFGSVPQGSTSASQAVTVTNDGASDLVLGTFSLSGANAAHFAIVAGGTCVENQTLAAAASCTIALAFSPNAGGAFAGTLTVGSNATNGNVALTGTGLSMVNGACGPVNAVATRAFPAGVLCTAGNAASQATGALAHTWDCAGIGGGTTASCSAPRLFSVTVSNAVNGTVVPTGAQDVMAGNRLTVAVTPSAGYSVTVGGTCGGTLAGTSFETAAVTADCTVAPSFAWIPLVQSITVGPVADRTYGDAAVPLVASASSGLPVAWASATPAVCTVGGPLVTLRGAGACSIVVSQAGDAIWAPAPDATIGFTVGKAAQAIAFGELANRTLGDPAVPLAATGGGSQNPIVFTSLTDATCRIHQNRLVVMLDTGDCTVAADQAGNANWLAAPRVTRAFRIVHNEMPQPFSFAPRDGVRIGTLVESAPVAIYGITGPVDVVVEGGEISIGCDGTWVPGRAQLSPGQQFCVRHVSAGQPLTEARTRVYVGMSSADFVSRTGKAEPRLVLEASTNPSRYRSEVTFTVTAIGAGAPVTGTVGLRFGPAPVIGCEALAFEANVATCRTDSLAPGVRDVVARYDGDETWAWAEASLSHYVRPELRTSFRDPTATGTAAFYMATAQGGLALVTVSQQGAAPPAVLQPEGEGWSIAHFADFNADGKADLLFVNADGRHALWLMDGEQVLAKSDLIRAAERLTVPMVGDFNGDGRDDLLVKDATGRYAIWLVNGTDVTTRNPLADAGPDLVPTSLADLDADGTDDLVLERADGRFRLMLVKNGQAGAFADFERPGAGYTAAQFADFNGDYRTDLWFRGPAGDVFAWRMDGVKVLERTMVIGPTAWRVTNVADFDTDGADDFLLTHADGGAMIWTMDGLKVASGAIVVDPQSPPAWQRLAAADGTPIETRPADWRVVQVGDFDGDGLPDLAFLHKGGTLVVVVLKGLEVSSAYAVTPPAGWNLVED